MASAPASSGANPYIDLFYAAVKPLGIRLVGACHINDLWLRENASRLDAIHLHWPEDNWRYARNRFGGALRGIIGFWKFLRLTRRFGISIIWTVHNLEHHEGIDWIDHLGYRLLARYADLLICHSYSARNVVEKRWRPSGRIIVMQHGNYDGVYPEPRPRREVLERMGLQPDVPTVCCVGGIRKYKGVDVAVEAIGILNGGYQLIVAGWPSAKYDLGGLRRTTDNMPFVRVLPQLLSAQDFADIVGASDAVLLPYHHITGSGAFMAAMTLSRGVVASDLPYFREMLSVNGDAGRLFSPRDAEALALAIKEYLLIPHERRQNAARSLAADCAWDRIVKPICVAIKQCVAERMSKNFTGKRTQEDS